MKKILLMTLNAKFIHTGLAIHSLKRYWDHNGSHGAHVVVKEYTINNTTDDILMDLVKNTYDCIFVSAYIWNIELLSVLFANYNTIRPETYLIFGGPEVTYNPLQQLKNNPFMHAVISGEGEIALVDAIEALINNKPLDLIKGIYVRDKSYDVNHLVKTEMPDMDKLPFPYDDLSQYEHKILYYESSRGCPYSCSYCLSSATQGVRFKPLAKVYKDLSVFLREKVKQVKFVDRTFNLSKKHAIPILQYLINHDNGVTNFHFEINADLLDAEYIRVINGSRRGLFQFEIGVQTTHEPTMFAINRPITFSTLKENTQALIATGKAHTHVDLIAGLPYETFERFLQSFDECFDIGADHLQLGFLKLLKGTALYDKSIEHAYKIRKESPYEILENKYISFSELSRLKRLEQLVELYLNSGKFLKSLPYAMKAFGEKPSVFFLKMVDYWEKHLYFESPVSTYALYDIFNAFYKTQGQDQAFFNDLLKFDYSFARLKGQKDVFHYVDDPTFNQKRLALLRNRAFIETYLPTFQEISGKGILKHVDFVLFQYDVFKENACKELTLVLFDYSQQDVSYFKIDMNTYWREHE